MYQHSRLFGTARIPTESGCQIVQDPHSRHIVILCKGQFYWFDVFDEKSDLILSEKDLAQNLQVIVEDAQATPIQEAAKGALGVLSTENRKVWSGLRDVISRDECSNNSECLSIVDTALFVLCLDSTEPRNPSELCMTMLCGSNKVEKGIQIGTCTNRWYDKLQLIVCKNGSAGINFEHTGVDGHTVLRFASDVYTDTILRFARTINGQAPSLWASDSPDPAKRDRSTYDHSSTTPHKLEWDMIPELRTALRFAETRLADLIQQNEFQTLEFMTYGKNFITKNGFSPDAFVQMAFQAAYYGLYGRLESVYEPAMTKIYLHGRTEAIRSVTAESAEFVRTFWENKAARQKIEALRKACRKHTEISKLCGKAQGQDRHLYALYCIWQRAAAAPSDCFVSTNSTPNKSHVNGDNGNNKARSSPSPHISPLASPSSPSSRPKATTTTSDNVVCAPDSPVRSTHHAMPALFADSGWDTLNSTILSTSNCGNPSLRQFGFGPTSGNGFGIGYIIKDGSVSICASSKHRQTRRYVDAIESYLLEVRRLLRQLEREVADSSFKKEGTGEDVVTVNINGEGGCKGQRKVGRRLSRGRIVGSEVGKSEAVAATASNLTATAQMTRQKYGMDDGEEVEEHDFGGCEYNILSLYFSCACLCSVLDKHILSPMLNHTFWFSFDNLTQLYTITHIPSTLHPSSHNTNYSSSSSFSGHFHDSIH